MKHSITKDYFKDKRVLVFGFGTNGGGLGTVRFLLGTEVKEILVTDQKEKELLKSTLEVLPDDQRLTWRFGEHRMEDFENVDIVVKNPGIRWDNPYILRAREYGASILMDSSIFFALCPVPIIGITGSKGKTTTASLVAHILESAGRKVVRVGVSQIGVLSELEKITPESIVVFELSSWRLSGLREVELSPHIALITNLYPDHLNYYPDMEVYAEDKAEIFLWQDSGGTLILPHNNEWTEWFASQAPGRVLSFGFNSERDAWQDQESLWIKDGEKNIKVIQKNECLLQGSYNFDNFLAATLAALEVGLSKEQIEKGLKSFSGVPHRFERVAVKNGVTYINDTAATIPEAVKASVEALDHGRVILLAGGSDKDLPLEPLIETIQEKVHYTILFQGSATEKIIAALEKAGYGQYFVASSMGEALLKAQEVAENGDTVLLSPGAASFGMFKNEFDRGDQFRDQVRSI